MFYSITVFTVFLYYWSALLGMIDFQKHKKNYKLKTFKCQYVIWTVITSMIVLFAIYRVTLYFRDIMITGLMINHDKIIDG